MTEVTPKRPRRDEYEVPDLETSGEVETEVSAGEEPDGAQFGVAPMELDQKEHIECQAAKPVRVTTRGNLADKYTVLSEDKALRMGLRNRPAAKSQLFLARNKSNDYVVIKVCDRDEAAAHQVCFECPEPKYDELVVALWDVYYEPTIRGKVYENQFALVMEFMEKMDLSQHVQEIDLANPEAEELAADMIRAVDHVHNLGIVHGDIKPENMLFDGGRAKISDFGTASFGDHGRIYCGTPQYMAPELLSVKPATKASDMWALGASLYFLMTASHRIEAEAHDLEHGVTEEQIRAMAHLPAIPLEVRRKYPNISALVDALMVFDPDRRPTSEEVVGLKWVERQSD